MDECDMMDQHLVHNIHFQHDIFISFDTETKGKNTIFSFFFC